MSIASEETSQFNLAELPQLLMAKREEILANLVLLAQLPGKTGEEEQRVTFMLDRFVEAGISETGKDETGNAVAMLPGSDGESTVCVVSHLDTLVPNYSDLNTVVHADRVVGPGVCDNALGAAVVSALPICLAELGIQLKSNLLLVGSVKSLERSNHEGIRFLLDHGPKPINAGIVVEGAQLGRLNYFSIGTLRGDIVCDVRPSISRSYGSESALVVLNHIINRILRVMVPTRPYTTIRLGKIRAGIAYDTDPDHSELGLEVISHSDEVIDRIQAEIEDIVSETSTRHSVNAQTDFFFKRNAAGIPFSHPLVKRTLSVMETLGIEPDQGHSPSELSEFISRDIPAVTLGISQGEKNKKQPDEVQIEPILTGVSQIIGVLMEIDGGALDES